MPTLQRLALLALTAALWASPVDARVRVTFQNAETYAGPDLHGLPVRAELRAHLERLGTRYFGSGSDLKINVLDFRLAGQYAWWLTPPSVRIMNENTWPVITLRYTLTQHDKTIASGEETISNHFYLAGSRAASSGPLPYEKAMLDDWFRDRFGRR